MDTATRELLLAVKSAEVWQDDTSATTYLYLSQVFGMSEPWQDVTQQITEAQQAGLVRSTEVPQSHARLWQLTKRGEKALSGRPAFLRRSI